MTQKSMNRAGYKKKGVTWEEVSKWEGVVEVSDLFVTVTREAAGFSGITSTLSSLPSLCSLDSLSTGQR